LPQRTAAFQILWIFAYPLYPDCNATDRRDSEHSSKAARVFTIDIEQEE
jgi:hypothetical protein